VQRAIEYRRGAGADVGAKLGEAVGDGGRRVADPDLQVEVDAVERAGVDVATELHLVDDPARGELRGRVDLLIPHVRDAERRQHERIGVAAVGLDVLVNARHGGGRGLEVAEHRSARGWGD